MPKVFFLWLLLLLLSGCSDMMMVTPQISLASADKAVRVKSKVTFVSVIAYSPDGKYLISGGANSVVRVWDVDNARELMKLTIPLPSGALGGLSDVSYSPDGKILATATRTGIFSGDVTKLLDAETGREIRTINGVFGGLLSFSNDGKYLLGLESTIELFSMDSPFTVKLADVQTGEVIQTFKGFMRGSLAPDGSMVALAGFGQESSQPDISAVDLKSNREIWRNQVGNVSAIAFAPDSKTLLVGTHKAVPFGDFDIYLKELNAANGNQTREIAHYTIPGGLMPVDATNSQIQDFSFSPDGKFFVSANMKGEYRLWDSASGRLIRQLKRPDEKIAFGISSSHSAFSPNGKVLAIASAASTRLYDVESGEETAAMIAFDDGEWLISTPNGYYNSSEKGDEYLDVSVAGKAFSTSQLRESFFRPDLVKVALSGVLLKDFRKIEDIKQPPMIAIVETPTSATEDQITVSLQVKDQGGGIGDVRLYRNGTAVVLEKTRNLQVESATQGGRVLRYNVRLEAGKNAIRAIAFNADNSMQSSDANLEIQASFASRPPALYAVVVGIKDYVNPRLALNYPVADAELFAATLEGKGKGLFDSVYIQRLVKAEDTTNTAIIAALKQAQRDVRPEDLFVFYVASHGTVDDGQYLLITSNVGSTSTLRLKQDALPQDVLKELISNIPASKKLIVLDTCNAGKMGDVLQMAMLTRGMSEDTAMKVLSRAVGSTILSAASSVQEALEGYKNHGLFTWVVAEGLNGAADADKDGFVKTLELADYVDNQVPELAERVFHHKQFPIVSPTGQGFPLSRVR